MTDITSEVAAWKWVNLSGLCINKTSQQKIHLLHHWVTVLCSYLRTCHDLQAGHYLSSLASVQPCNPAAVALVSVQGSSVTQTDTMATLCSPHSIVLPWTWRHNEALIHTGQGDRQARCQVLFFQACLWAEPMRTVYLKTTQWYFLQSYLTIEWGEQRS